jgi:CMP-N-acetylneuraminic acid synthetase
MHVWATSPYRKKGDLDNIIELLMSDQNATAALSVTTPGQSPFKMFKGEQTDSPYLVPLLKDSYPELYDGSRTVPHESPRQSLPKTVQLTGYMAAIRPKTILELNSMMGPRILPFYHDPDTYTEADSYKDLKHAELVLQEMAEKGE